MDTPDERKRKKKRNIIIAIIVSILLIIIIVVVIIIVLWYRRREQALPDAIDCRSDADCILDFKCNTTTGTCSQCLVSSDCPSGQFCNGVICVGCNEDADCDSVNPGDVCIASSCVTPCSTSSPSCPTNQTCNFAQERCVNECSVASDCVSGETCTGGACICPTPVIQNAFVAGGGELPITLSVNISVSGSTSGIEYRATFRSEVGWEVATPFGTSTPVRLSLPGTCGGPNTFWGCGSCGSAFNTNGIVEVQIRNSCGSVSEIYRIPSTGQCNFCNEQVCQ